MDVRSPWARSLPLLLVLLLFVATGCSQDSIATPRSLAAGGSATPTFTPLPSTATAAPTGTPTASPTPTQTPSPTPTPTATARPVILSGDPRGYAQRPAEPQPSAVCGVVDFFDFPVGPPDAVEVDRGGTDYARYRERYNGIHTGEDWSGPHGRSLGSPVYAIGHGRVIYAHPNGWGTDKGTVIVRHVLPDGTLILSFYGHLDPPSVDLRYGQCVARGEKLGEIGDPRGRPHLHWEIRTHIPNEPGPGYWSEDPSLAGWFPPSLTVWESRYRVSPGTLWARRPEAGSNTIGFAGAQAVGFPTGDLLLLLEQGRLRGLGAGDGRLRWTQPDPPAPAAEPDATLDPTRAAREMEAAAPVSAALDDLNPLLYAVDRRRRVQAYATGAGTEPPLWDALWQVELPVTGSPTLYPLPGGGVLAVGRSEMVALDAQGRQQWAQAFAGVPGAAIRAGERLYLPVEQGEPALWVIGAAGADPWPGLPPGTPRSYAGNPVWWYAREAIYRLDPETGRAEPVLALPRGFFGPAAHGAGGAVALPDGGLLLAHHDLDDDRLLRLDETGTLLWERSYRRLNAGEAQLALLQGQPFLALVEPGATTLVTLFAVAPEDGSLVKIFAGGTRTGQTRDTWLLPAPGGLLLNIGGGHLVALDPAAAVEALAPSPGDISSIEEIIGVPERSFD